MPLEQFIQQYGYWALLVGAFLEGETILIIAGFSAHLGYLKLPLVILIGSAATIVSDQSIYFLGRLYGAAFIEKRPAWKSRIQNFSRLLHRHQNLVIIGFRFMYGMRIVGPFAIGMSGIKVLRFALLNILSALVWTTVFGAGGYFCGAALNLLLGNIRKYELMLIAWIAVIGVLVGLVHFFKARRAKSREQA